MRNISNLRQHSEHSSSNPRVLFLSSHFRNAAEVRGFAEHVRHLAGADSGVAMAVADNSRDLVPFEMTGVSIHRPSSNLGYLSGCAFALDRWLHLHRDLPEWVAVTNTDIRLADDFLVRLAGLSLPLDAGVLAPEIVLPDGGRQNPLLRERPSPQTMRTYARLMRRLVFSTAFELTVRIRHAVRACAPAGLPDDAMTPIYAPHGSLMLFHRRFFVRGGILAYGALMYGEEIHIAEQARRAGVAVVMCRALIAHHFQHSTTSKVPVQRRSEWRAESAEHLWQSYFREETA